MMLNKKNSQPFIINVHHSIGRNCKFEFCSVIGNCIVLVLNFLMHFYGSIYVSNIDHSSHFLMKFFSFCNVIGNFLVYSLNFLMPPNDSIYASNINHNSNFLIKFFSFCNVIKPCACTKFSYASLFFHVCFKHISQFSFSN